MMRVVAALVVVAMGGCSFIGVRGPSSTKLDCTDKFGLPVFDTVIFAAATAVAISVFYVEATAEPCTGECGDGPDLAGAYAQVVGIPTALLAILYGTSAVHGYSTVAQCNSSNQRQPTDAERAEMPAKAALAMTAARAARAGDCATVAKLDAQVRDIDVDYHMTVFRRDVAIKRCLDAAAPAPVTAPAPATPPEATP